MLSMNTAPSSVALRRSQRSSVRHAVRLECEVVRERDFKLIASRAVDLSPDGMLVLSDVSVLTGEDVIVSFRAPHTTEWVDACGTVARVVHGRRPGDFGPCLGIQFDDVEELSRALLEENLQMIPPPLPRREARLDYAAMVTSALV